MGRDGRSAAALPLAESNRCGIASMEQFPCFAIMSKQQLDCHVLSATTELQEKLHSDVTQNSILENSQDFVRFVQFVTCFSVLLPVSPCGTSRAV